MLIVFRVWNCKRRRSLVSFDETFLIKVRNHKKDAVTVRVVEHLYRGLTWTLPAYSIPFVKKDAHTVEFSLLLPPDEERAVTYTAHYTW